MFKRSEQFTFKNQRNKYGWVHTTEQSRDLGLSARAACRHKITVKLLASIHTFVCFAKLQIDFEILIHVRKSCGHKLCRICAEF